MLYFNYFIPGNDTSLHEHIILIFSISSGGFFFKTIHEFVRTIGNESFLCDVM